MHRVGVALAGLCLALMLFSSGAAQRQREALTDPEIDQLRDTAVEPDLRLKLYVTFARARLAKLGGSAIRSQDNGSWPGNSRPPARLS